MPTYDYACEACGHHWDVEQRMSEDAIKKCPKCKRLKARRQITGANFILKGSGWYADLYSSSKPAAKPAAAEGASESAPTETKTETKTEAKAETPKAAPLTEAKSESKPATKKKKD